LVQFFGMVTVSYGLTMPFAALKRKTHQWRFSESLWLCNSRWFPVSEKETSVITKIILVTKAVLSSSAYDLSSEMSLLQLASYLLPI